MDTNQFNGNSWEEFCQKILKIKFYDDYVIIPDRYHGDCGIEGYTFSGDVFQFYCKDEELSSKELYKQQRNKITRDLNKLSYHKNELIKILGDVKIKNWIFLTPYYENKDLVAHCRKKEKEIKEKNIAFIDDNFRVKILTYDHFLPEIQTLINFHQQVLSLQKVKVKKEDISEWKKKYNDYYNEMYRKIYKIYSDPEKTEEIVELYIKNYLIGWKYLDQLLKEFPAIHQKILIKKNSLAFELKSFGKSDDRIPSKFLKDSFTIYENEIKKEHSIQRDQINYIAFEAIGEWLYNCTIDF